MKITLKTLFWLTAFSIAMGYLETTVVVYLRLIYYPEGFRFPLVPIGSDIAVTEFLRELATMVMLGGIGWLTGKNTTQRFAFFLYSFAVWDIFYYVFLYALLGWPESLFTWDILFLIPVTWVGPVLAPCLVALTMIIFTTAVVWLSNRHYPVRIPKATVTLWIAGSLVVIGSFVYDYLAFVSHTQGLAALWTPGKQEALFAEIAQYVPVHYPWEVFLIGEVLLLLGIWLFVRYNLYILPRSLAYYQPPFSRERSSGSVSFSDEWEAL